MFEYFSTFFSELMADLAGVDVQVVLLAAILIAAVIVLDATTMSARKEREASGIDARATAISIDGSRSVPVKHYLSEMQALAGRPDALVSEGGFIIPVERKPLARKIHDRYVAQLLVYMRLVEEFEGKKPPYGYLILGPNCRKFRIDNTPERQSWLQTMIDTMQAALGGIACALPAPHARKCGRCDVSKACEYALVNRANRTRKAQGA